MMAQKIRIAMAKKGINSLTKLVEKIEGCSLPNLSQKIKRDNFSEKELQAIAKALDCELRIDFVDKTTGEVL